MPFGSFAYIFVFLPVAASGYFLLRRLANEQLPKLWLLVVSLIFVGASGERALAVLLVSLTVNCFVAGRLVQQNKESVLSPRALLILGITLNVLFLCYFKYAGFFLQTFVQLFGKQLRIPISPFPLGISFFTIYQIMLLVQSYDGLLEQHRSLDHFVFGSMFLYVSMGPLVRWDQIVPQINDRQRWRPDADNIAKGVFLFAIGFFKKVVLADTFFRWADAGFSYAHTLSCGGAWIAALAFTFQLYFDFSGYTDMAIGAGLMLNLDLPQNFNAPYRAKSIIEFWRRWHITLTDFITTYLYMPMVRAMSEVTFVKGMVITVVAMLIAGFWHGANWTFVAFGGLHGLALVINQVARKFKVSLPDPLAWLITFVFVVIGFVFFRSASLRQAADIVGSMFAFHGIRFDYEPWTGIDRVEQVTGALCMTVGVFSIWRAPSSMQLQRDFRPSWVTLVATVALTFAACLYSNGVVSKSFVYNEF